MKLFAYCFISSRQFRLANRVIYVIGQSHRNGHKISNKQMVCRFNWICTGHGIVL